MLENLKKISGYSESKFVDSYELKPKKINDLKSIIQFSKINNYKICCKGSGLSYGDMITNENNIILDLTNFDRIINFDNNNGTILVQAGVNLGKILQHTLLNKWTISSCPGSFEITIGGAISNNVHGKDSYSKGNFGSQVIELKVILESGEERIINKNTDERLYNAFIGGMGFLGIIIEAKLKLTKIPSPFVKSKKILSKNIDQTIDLIEENKNEYDFIVGWIDCFADNSKIGRGYVSLAKWISKETDKDLNYLINKSLTKSNKVFGMFPKELTWKTLKYLFNRQSVKIFNSLLYNYQLIKNNNSREILFTEYNFIHNTIPDMKNIFRPHGFLEFQPLIPVKDAKKNIKTILNLCKRYKYESLLAGLKLHKSDNYFLSYQMDGYSLGIDFGLYKKNLNELEKFSRILFDFIINCGGKIYLAKDQNLNKLEFLKMYPNIYEFLEIKKNYDHSSLFSSDLYKRLTK